MRDPRASTRFERLWETGRVVTAAAHLGLDAQPLEARRDRLWAAARKPPVKVTPSRAGSREARRAARGGASQ